MNSKVKLQDIIDQIQTQFDETHSFVNLKTGQTFFVTTEELRKAEEDDELFEGLAEWEIDSLKLAIDVLENEEDYLELPDKFEINEYEMIEDYCYSISNENYKNILLRAIQGKGAFRRFKDQIIDLGIEQDWYQFQGEKYKEIAIKWCKNHEIEYVE
ncbi:hypothetical protein H1D32_11935 [Anaerobacillus sp. CMMVII]|uniref:UPF0158 family protein n=1 Tax=Anaerobacillus sp. CMMVII TaxID=2755588 RepID=UPI0021B7D710|nr:UPF0158 family protein [Anaerobacillus sp. CMMVII]MCT8138397.1 hypothetical protein [Anaerobacillus sp. CMMVII]